jgi:hypothetical protein
VKFWGVCTPMEAPLKIRRFQEDQEGHGAKTQYPWAGQALRALFRTGPGRANVITKTSEKHEDLQGVKVQEDRWA